MTSFAEKKQLETNLRRNLRFAEILLVFFLFVGLGAGIFQLIFVPAELDQIRQNSLNTIQVFNDTVMEMKEISERINKLLEEGQITKTFASNYSSVPLFETINQKIVSQFSKIENPNHSDFLANLQVRVSTFKRDVVQYENDLGNFIKEMNVTASATPTSLESPISLEEKKGKFFEQNEQLVRRCSHLIRDFQALSFAVTQDTGQNLEAFGDILRIYFKIFLGFLSGVVILTLMTFSRILRKVDQLALSIENKSSDVGTGTISLIPPLPPSE